MTISDNFNPKESESRKLLAEIDFNLGGFLAKTFDLITDPYTYNVRHNPFLWLGVLLALPVPVYLGIYEFNLTEPYLVSGTFLFVSLGHLMGMSLLFGALGSLYWDHYADLQHQATHDQLTNLLTHGTFLEVGKRRVKEARRYDKVLSFMMLDLDHFKKVNDTLGHTKGDEILVRVANILKKETREADVVGRYGGEEFAILLPETSLKDSYQVAERIRNLVEDAENLPEYLTISGGVGSFPLTAQTLDGLIETVDECLYCAKEEGRNRIKTVMELPDSRKPDRRHISVSDMV